MSVCGVYSVVSEFSRASLWFSIKDSHGQKTRYNDRLYSREVQNRRRPVIISTMSEEAKIFNLFFLKKLRNSIKEKGD